VVRQRRLLTWLAIGVAVAPLLARQEQDPTTIWPGRDWQTATPESQGMDSGVLAEMLELVRARHLPLHAVFLVRNGRVVLDSTIYPYDGTRPHDIASATKTVTSILIGLAIDIGFVKDVRTPVLSVLPHAAPPAPDARLARMTVEDLLTMRSGLDCGIQSGEQELSRMRRSPNWPSFALALPMRGEPGAGYAYCSCNHHLLSAIVSARSGDSALALARQRLFEPLDIRDVIWPADPKGRTHGWGDLHLYPRDLARIGYLFLRGGSWRGRQIVSERWVRESIVPRVTVRNGEGYGYSWWLNTTRTPAVFEAVGRGGQRTAVLPDEDLVVVFNGGGIETGVLAPFLFRSLRSKASLPENPSALARLRQLVAELRQPPPTRAHGPLPQRASVISGVRYDIDANPADLGHLTLTFDGPHTARSRHRRQHQSLHDSFALQRSAGEPDARRGHGRDSESAAHRVRCSWRSPRVVVHLRAGVSQRADGPPNSLDRSTLAGGSQPGAAT
jgi:CubicO group peptidase (beta-lactamase class C family)